MTRPRPAGLADHPVPAQVVERAVGRGDHLDAEALEQRARPEARLGRGSCGDVRRRSRRRCRPTAGSLDAEDVLEGMVEPQARRRAAEAGGSSRRTGARSARGSVSTGPPSTRGTPRSASAHALGMQHAEDVVVGDDEELRRIGEGRVLGEPARVGVAVGADDRQRRDGRVEAPGQVAHGADPAETAGPDRERHASSLPPCSASH